MISRALLALWAVLYVHVYLRVRIIISTSERVYLALTCAVASRSPSSASPLSCWTGPLPKTRRTPQLEPTRLTTTGATNQEAELPKGERKKGRQNISPWPLSTVKLPLAGWIRYSRIVAIGLDMSTAQTLSGRVESRAAAARPALQDCTCSDDDG